MRIVFGKHVEDLGLKLLNFGFGHPPPFNGLAL
jgi:hypothetical protein